MKLTKNKLYIAAVFLLLWYCYFNSIRKIMIPMSSFTVPVLLAIVLIIVIWSSNGHIILSSLVDRVVCYSWIAIAALILVHNASFIVNIISGGMVQLYVMICFMLCVTGKTDWLPKWVKWTEVYAIIHAIATIIFYFNSSLFNSFAQFFFSGDMLAAVLRYYRWGYMTGLCTHFSSNGMILGIGLLFYFQDFLRLRREKRGSWIKNRKLIICMIASVLVLYALILSSKRATLLSALFSMCVVYIIYKRKNLGKRLAILFLVVGLLIGLYMVLAQSIPGLTTIVDKFQSLEESDAGVLNGRMGLWSLAVEMFKSSPVFGHGYGSYVEFAKSSGAITTSAHNYYLQLLAEQGFVGLILYLIGLIGAIVFTIKELQKRQIQSDSEISANVMYLGIALEIQIFVMLYNMTATAMMYYYILIPYFMAYAVPRALRGERS